MVWSRGTHWTLADWGGWHICSHTDFAVKRQTANCLEGWMCRENSWFCIIPVRPVVDGNHAEALKSDFVLKCIFWIGDYLSICLRKQLLIITNPIMHIEIRRTFLCDHVCGSSNTLHSERHRGWPLPLDKYFSFPFYSFCMVSWHDWAGGDVRRKAVFHCNNDLISSAP